MLLKLTMVEREKERGKKSWMVVVGSEELIL